MDQLLFGCGSPAFLIYLFLWSPNVFYGRHLRQFGMMSPCGYMYVHTPYTGKVAQYFLYAIFVCHFLCATLPVYIHCTLVKWHSMFCPLQMMTWGLLQLASVKFQQTSHTSFVGSILALVGCGLALDGSRSLWKGNYVDPFAEMQTNLHIQPISHR